MCRSVPRPSLAIWTAGLPAGKRTSVRGGHSAAALHSRRAHVTVFAPIYFIALHWQLAFTYNLPATAFPLSVPIESPTQILEVLVEDEKEASPARLKEKDPVALEKRSFRRYLADDVPMNAVAVIDLPPAPQQTVDRRFLVVLTVVIGGAMILALARAFESKIASPYN